MGQGMMTAPLKNTQQQRHWTPFQLEGFVFSRSSGHILQHRTLEAGFIGNHVFHVAHDMPGNCTLQIFPQGPSIPWNWTTQSPVKKLLLSEAFVCTLCWADCLTAQYAYIKINSIWMLFAFFRQNNETSAVSRSFRMIEEKTGSVPHGCFC